jgi:3-phytase
LSDQKRETISTASGSERVFKNQPLIATRSLPLAVLIVSFIFVCFVFSLLPPILHGNVIDLRPVAATDQVVKDPDDPAIWVHPSEPERSLILGTDKAGAPHGGLYLFGLDGKLRQKITGIDRPNNVDVEYGLMIGDRRVDIAVLTERYKNQLRAFRIEPDGSGVSDISAVSGLQVFQGKRGEQAAPMGIALYRRPSDGAIFAIVSRKTGPRDAYLWQYRLEDDGAGKVRATKVREFGRFSGRGEIEAVAVDDALGYVYYADEGNGIHKWHADPDHPDSGRELAHFGKDGFKGDREGIAIYAKPDGTGYLVCTDQLPRNSEYRVYRREGSSGRPHDHSEVVSVIRGGADSTDGIEITAVALGPRFSQGLLVAMNSSGRNFLLYSFPGFFSI